MKRINKFLLVPCFLKFLTVHGTILLTRKNLRKAVLGVTGFLVLMGLSHSAMAADLPASAISAGDTAWVLLSAGLVFLMTPGLAFF